MKSRLSIHFFITLGSILLFVPFLGNTHLFDWDEINFAESAREMIVTGDWSRVQIAFEPFWEKPPLFIWLQAISMKIFGINEFAARLPNALAGIVSLNVCYYIGRKHVGHFFGLFVLLAYAGSLAPSMYFKSGIIDPVFNLFIFLSVYQLFVAENDKVENKVTRINYLWAGLFAGLAVLTKGPVALLIIGLLALIRIIQHRNQAWPGWGNVGIAFFSFAIIVGTWLGMEIYHNGTWFIKEFFAYQGVLFKGQIEWHNQPWYYHILVLFFLCIPGAVFALPHLFVNQTQMQGPTALLFNYLRTLFWVVLVIFSLVTTKIIHYSSLCWIPLTFMSAYSMYGVYTNRYQIPKWLSIPALISIIPMGIVLCAGPLLLSPGFRHRIMYLLDKDEFAKNLLLSGKIWQGWEGIIPLILMIAAIIWIFRLALGFSKQPYIVFAYFGILGIYISLVILPKSEQQLQGDLIQHIKTVSARGEIIENRGFKSYAFLFYGKAKPGDFKGPWNEQVNQLQNASSSLPGYEARKEWLAGNTYSKPVYFVTKVNHDPGDEFKKSFQKFEIHGAYVLWKRKAP
jgi:4-amino-4-deoxy-L-arabinose transferase-like glycosyltransferase